MWYLSDYSTSPSPLDLGLGIRDSGLTVVHIRPQDRMSISFSLGYYCLIFLNMVRGSSEKNLY